MDTDMVMDMVTAMVMDMDRGMDTTPMMPKLMINHPYLKECLAGRSKEFAAFIRINRRIKQGATDGCPLFVYTLTQ